MHIEIITPDQRVFAGESGSVRFPGADGQFEVLDNHAPLIAALAAGEVVVAGAGSFRIGGGTVEVLRNRVLVLAESAA